MRRAEQATPSRFRGTEYFVAPAPVASEIRWFERFQQHVRKGSWGEIPASAQVVACMIAFDGGWTAARLSRTMAIDSEWRDMDGELSVSWTEGERVERRILSHFTRACWYRVRSETEDWRSQVVWSESAELVAKLWKEACGSSGTHQEIMRDLLAGGLAWVSHVLPPILSEHLHGRLSLAALSHHAWMRQFGVKPPTEATVDRSQDEKAINLSEEIIFTEARSSEWILAQLKQSVSEVAGPTAGLSNDRARKQLLVNLEFVRRELHAAGSPGLLLFGWVEDLALHGSARKEKPAINTIFNYLRVAGPALMRGMNSMEFDPIEADSQNWSALYEAARASASLDTHKTLVPALYSFHRYVVRTLDVDPVQFEDADEHPEVPAANVVWPNEFQEAFQILEDMPLKSRTAAQSKTLLALLRTSPLRRTEIFCLRLNSLHFGAEAILVNVASKPGHTSLKSKAAARSFEISTPQARELLVAWTERRRQEAAGGDDLLFGDPDDPKRLCEMGASYAAVITALKQATGDREVSFHTCRHTNASASICSALIAGTEPSIFPLVQIQRRIGHSNLITTFLTYFHLYERPMRHHLDQALAQQVTSADLNRWTGIPAPTLRKWKSRGGLCPSAWITKACWHAFPPTDTSSLPPPAEVRPVNGRSVPLIDLTVSQIVRILGHIQSGMSADGICSANSITPESLIVIFSHVVRMRGDGPIDLNADDLAPAAAAALQALDLSRLDWPRWKVLVRHSDTRPVAGRGELVDCWRAHGGGDGLDVCDPEAVLELLQALAKSAFESRHFRLRISRGQEWSSTWTADTKREHRIALVLADVFGAEVPIEMVKPRRGRPFAYLVPLTKAHPSATVPPAVVDSKSLSACMFSVSILKEVAVRVSNH